MKKKKVTVLIPRTDSDRRTVEILQRYADAGLVRPFIVCHMPDQAAWVHAGEGTEYRSLESLIAEIEQCDLIRFLCYTASSEPVDENYIASIKNLRDDSEKRDVKTVFGGVYGCTAARELPNGLFDSYNRFFNYNLVILPEHSLGEENSPTLSITTDNQRDEIVGSILAIVGGLWRWLDDSPLDALKHAGDDNRQRVRLARATTRIVKSEDFVAAAVDNILGGKDKSPLPRPRDCGHHGQPDDAIDELHSVLVPSSGRSPIGFSYRPYQSPKPRPEKQISILEVLKLFREELMFELMRAPKALLNALKDSVNRRTRRIEKKVEQVVAKQTFGTDSRIVVGIRDTDNVDLMMDQTARCTELNRIEDLGNYRAIRTAEVWRTLMDVVVSAADGGEIQLALNDWKGLQWHERPAVVKDLERLAPDLRSAPDDSMVRPHDVQAIRAILKSRDKSQNAGRNVKDLSGTEDPADLQLENLENRIAEFER